MDPKSEKHAGPIIRHPEERFKYDPPPDKYLDFKKATDRILSDGSLESVGDKLLLDTITRQELVILARVEGEMIEEIQNIRSLDDLRKYRSRCEAIFLKRVINAVESAQPPNTTHVDENVVLTYMRLHGKMLDIVLDHKARLLEFSSKRNGKNQPGEFVERDIVEVVSPRILTLLDNFKEKEGGLFMQHIKKMQQAQTTADLHVLYITPPFENYATAFKNGSGEKILELYREIYSDVYTVEFNRIKNASGIRFNYDKPPPDPALVKEVSTVSEAEEAKTKLDQYRGKIQTCFNYLRRCAPHGSKTQFLADWTVKGANLVRDITWLRKAYVNAHNFWERRTGRIEGEPLDNRLITEAAAFGVRGEWVQHKENDEAKYQPEDMLLGVAHGVLFDKLERLDQKRGKGIQLYQDELQASFMIQLDESRRGSVKIDLFDVFTYEKSNWDTILRGKIVQAFAEASYATLPTDQAGRVALREASYSPQRNKAGADFSYRDFFDINDKTQRSNYDFILRLNRTNPNHQETLYTQDSLFLTDSTEMCVDVDAVNGICTVKPNHTLWDGLKARDFTRKMMLKSEEQFADYSRLQPKKTDRLRDDAGKIPPVQESYEPERESSAPLLEAYHTEALELPAKKIVIKYRGKDYRFTPTNCVSWATALSAGVRDYHHLVDASVKAKKPKDPRWDNIQTAITITEAFSDPKMTASEFFVKMIDYSMELTRCENGDSTAAVLSAPLGDKERALAPITEMVDPAADLLLHSHGSFSPVPYTRVDQTFINQSELVKITGFDTAHADVYTRPVDLHDPENGMGIVGYYWEPGSKSYFSLRLEPGDMQVRFAAFARYLDKGKGKKIKPMNELITQWMALAQGKITGYQYQEALSKAYRSLNMDGGALDKLFGTRSPEDLQRLLNREMRSEAQSRLAAPKMNKMVRENINSRFVSFARDIRADVKNTDREIIIDLDTPNRNILGSIQINRQMQKIAA